MPGLNQMTSSSSDGASVITLQFVLDLDIDVAEQEVQAAINAAGTYLPPDLPNPPIYSKINPADAPILTLALTSTTLPLSAVEDLADTRLALRLSQLTGVGLVTISGGQKPAVRIQANPTQLVLVRPDARGHPDRGCRLERQSGQGQLRRCSPGVHDRRQRSVAVEQPVSAARRRLQQRGARAAVGCRDGDRLGRERASGRVDERRAGGDRQHPAPARRQHHRRRRSDQGAAAAARRPRCPRSVQMTILTDRTTTIRASVSDVEFELMLTIALVVMVIFLFLRTLSATVIPSVAVPLSLVGTFGVMYLLGYSLNNLTLMALTISTGFVVDDAIVMIENIARYIEDGVAPLEAALRGSAQIGFTILSLTVSLIAVLIPLLFMGDIVGRLFREFAVTLSVTILVSAVVSLTLTPMMCARLLRRRPASEQGVFYRKSEAGVRGGHRVLRPHAPLGARTPDGDAARGGRHPRAHRRALHRHPQGLLSARGHRRDRRHLRSAAVGVVRGDGRAAAGAGAGHPAGSGGREPVVVHRHRRQQHDAQHRPDAGEPQARAGETRRCDRCDPAASAGAREGGRHHAVHAAGPGSERRDSGEPHAVPVHASKRQRRRACRLGAAVSRAPEGAPDAARRRQRSAERGPAGARRHRSRHGGPSRDHAADARRRALRRVWPAADFHDVHPVEPVSGRAGDRSVVPTRPGRSPAHLPAVGGRRRPDSLECLHAHRDDDRAALDQSPGAVPGRDLLLQSRARRLAGQRRRGGGPGQAADRAAGELRNRVSGNRAGVSGGARQRACCSFWPR